MAKVVSSIAGVRFHTRVDDAVPMGQTNRVVVVTTHRGHGEDLRVFGIFADMGAAVAAVKDELDAWVWSTEQGRAAQLRRRDSGLFGYIRWMDVRT